MQVFLHNAGDFVFMFCPVFLWQLWYCMSPVVLYLSFITATREHLMILFLELLWLVFFSYRSIYEPYKHLLSKDADNKVDKFLSRDRSLREYTNEIEKLKKMERDIASFPVLVPMYFFLLDCSYFNQVRQPCIQQLFNLNMKNVKKLYLLIELLD